MGRDLPHTPQKQYPVPDGLGMITWRTGLSVSSSLGMFQFLAGAYRRLYWSRLCINRECPFSCRMCSSFFVGVVPWKYRGLSSRISEWSMLNPNCKDSSVLHHGTQLCPIKRNVGGNQTCNFLVWKRNILSNFHTGVISVSQRDKFESHLWSTYYPVWIFKKQRCNRDRQEKPGCGNHKPWI